MELNRAIKLIWIFASYLKSYFTTRMSTISYSIGGEQHDISGKSGEEVVKMVEEEYAKQKNIKFNIKKVEEEEEVPEFNGDKMDSILYPDRLDWSFDKPTEGKYHTIYIIKKVEEVEEYLCVDCGKDFKWKSGTSSAGAGVNSYHCGSCGVKEWDSFNKKQAEEEEEEDQCEVCDTKTKTTIKTYGCMDMSVCKNCEDE